MLHIFSYLPHKELCRVASVCKKWRLLIYDSKLWARVSLRPEFSNLHVGNNVEGIFSLSIFLGFPLCIVVYFTFDHLFYILL